MSPLLQGSRGCYVIGKLDEDCFGYAALITLVIITTLMTPPALKWSWRGDDGLRRVSGQEA